MHIGGTSGNVATKSVASMFMDTKLSLICNKAKGFKHEKRQQSFEGQKNQVLKWVWNVPLHILVSKWIRYMCPKSHTHKRCGSLRKESISARALTYKGRSLTIKKTYKKFLY
jgi:hypothetical protein